jgi:uncharacterized protein
VTAPAARDRDGAGRARNARPRDELGRPLPHSPLPGTPLPGSPAEAVPGIPDDLVVSPEEAAELGARLLAEGRPFHAHEVFEAAWKSVQGPERELWRGLAQIAVGLTHARRGNASGAVTLLRRGAGHVAGFTGASRAVDPGLNDPGLIDPGLIDPHFVAAQAAGIALRIERDGLAAVPDADLRLKLRSG